MTVTFSRLGQYGRLGNALFQMAATIALASRSGDSFLFPHWEYENDFSISHVFGYVPKYPTYTEQHFHFTPISCKPPINLHGYFQSDKYFKDQSHIIEKLLTPKYIGNFEGYTSIHVRRGDYLIHKDCYTILDMKNYYEKAISACPSKKYLVFSDDIGWCRGLFAGNNFDFSEERHPVKDLGNMLSCGNHIIANSSFSWWGAWLSKSANKKVIAPANWFGPKLAPTHDTKDLYPEGWVKV